MKFVEKKCPNCGAGLKFDDNATSVVCEYCSKTYYIQRDEKKYARLDESHKANAYKFVDEVGKPIVKAFATVHIAMMIIPIVMFILIAGGIGVSIYNFSNDNPSGGSHNDKIDEVVDKWQEEADKAYNERRAKMVQKISQIDSVSLQTFHDTSLQRLQTYDGSCVHGDYKITKDWESVGVYLLVAKEDNENILYDVFSHTYKNKKTGKQTTLYAAVKYDDLFLTDNNIVENDYFAWPEVPSYNFPGTSFVGAYGYEGNDKLYNKLVRSQSGDYIIEASDGLYVES